jgi:hypothetical protein
MRVNPHTPITDYTFAAYDCAQLQISAIMQAVHDAKGSLPNRPQVLNAVAHITFKGLMGSYTFDPNGDAIAPLMEIYDVERSLGEQGQDRRHLAGKLSPDLRLPLLARIHQPERAPICCISPSWSEISHSSTTWPSSTR